MGTVRCAGAFVEDEAGADEDEDHAEGESEDNGEDR